MPVSATTVTQYYTGIFRQAPSAAVAAGYQAMATDAAALNSMLSAANVQVDPVIRLYQTAFNRVPDNAGLTAWVVPYSTGAITLQSIANGFTQSTEFTTLYPTSMSNAQYVGALYWNILQRAGEDAGIRGWTDALNSGALTRAQVLLGFSNSAEFETKIEPSVNQFLTNIAKTPIANQGAATLYTGSLFDQGGVVPGSTFNLTTALDITSADVVNGVIQTNIAAGQTFQTGDQINGSGANTVNVTVAGTNNTTAAQISNVANVNFTLLTGALEVVNAALYTGVSNINTKGGNIGGNVLGITNGALATTYGVINDTGNGLLNDGLFVAIRASDLAGTADTMKFSLNGSGLSIAVPGAASVANTFAITAASAGVEKVSIATTGTNIFSITGTPGAGVLTDYATLEITGNGSNTISAGGYSTNAKLFDMSTSTGTNTLNLAGGLTSSTTIKGGTGTDVLRVAQASTAAALTATGVETLRLSTGNNTGTLQFATAPNFTTVRMDGDTAEAGTQTLSNMGTIGTIAYKGEALTASSATLMQFKNLSILGSLTGSADSVAVTIDNGGITNTAGNTMNTLTVNGAETLTVTVSDAGAGSTTTFTGISDTTLGSISVTSTGAVALGTLNAAPAAGAGNISLIDLSNVKGTAVSSVTIADNSIGAATVMNAATGTGGTTVTLAAEATTDSLIYTGGAGVDTINGGLFTGTIVANGGSGADVLVGGFGADNLTGGEGSDLIYGNAGADTIILTELVAAVDTYIFAGQVAVTSANPLPAADVVIGFGTNDVLGFGSTFLGTNVYTSTNFSMMSAVPSALAATAGKINVVSADLAGAGGSAAIAAIVAGFSAATSDQAVVIADDGHNAYVWYVNDGLDGTVTSVTSTDIVLLGTLNSVNVAGFTAANFAAAAAA